MRPPLLPCNEARGAERFVVIMGLYYMTAAVPLAAQEAAAGKRTPEITNELRNELQAARSPDEVAAKGKIECEEGDLNPHGCYPTGS